MKSKFDPEANYDEERVCPYCGSAVFHNEISVWCVNNKQLEDGNCNYILISG